MWLQWSQVNSWT